MPLVQKLGENVKAAMKSGDKERLDALRYLLSLLQNAQKEKNAKQPDAPLTDEEAVAVLQKEAKRRKDAIALFRQGGRADLIEKEEAGLAIVHEYIPKELSEEEIGAMVDDLRAKGMNDFNALMREVMKAAKGRADGKTVGEIIRKKTG